MSSNIFGYSTATNFSNRLPDTAALANFVTLTTTQTISGQKTFTAPVVVDGLTATTISATAEISSLDVAVNQKLSMIDPLYYPLYSNTVTTLEQEGANLHTKSTLQSSGFKVSNGDFNGALWRTLYLRPNITYLQTIDSLVLGAGGVQDVPSSSVEVTPTTVSLTGTTVRNLATISLSDDSTMVATTQWVRSVFTPTPTGTISMYGGQFAPSGYVFCNGAQYNATDPIYSPLYAVIGSYFTQGGSLGYPNFNAPDFRGIFPSMPGTNVTSAYTYPNLPITGPQGVGLYQRQSTVFVDHQHTTNYPSQSVGVSTNTLANCYKSGSSQQTAASSVGNNIAAPQYTDINGAIRPISIGIYYIIKL